MCTNMGDVGGSYAVPFVASNQYLGAILGDTRRYTSLLYNVSGYLGEAKGLGKPPLPRATSLRRPNFFAVPLLALGMCK